MPRSREGKPCPGDAVRKLPEAFGQLLDLRVGIPASQPPDPRACCTVLEPYHLRYLVKEPFHCRIVLCMSQWTSQRLAALVRAQRGRGGMEEGQILHAFVAQWLRLGQRMADPSAGSLKVFSLVKGGANPHAGPHGGMVHSHAIQSAVGRIDVHAIPLRDPIRP